MNQRRDIVERKETSSGKEPSSGIPHNHNFVNRYVPEEELRKPSQEVAHAISNATKQELNRLVGAKTDTAYSSTVGNLSKQEGQYIKYTPKQQGDGHNSAASQRIIKMHEVQVDPLEPAKFKHKRIPRGPGSPPKTIMHSPPRKLTVKDQQDWKIPPCISNWKNAKGYTIPLEMRLSADGRTLQQHTINEKFAKLANAFYIAERQSRKEIEERNKIQKTMAYKDYLKQETKMREAAALARTEKTKILETTVEETEESGKRQNPYIQEETLEEEEAKKDRDMFRYINKRELERDRRLEVARNKKSKAARDAERDISEKIALGQAQPTISKESMYDQRLFNQTSGLESGFGDEDEYNAFDKPLFADKTAASIYNIKEYTDDVDEAEPTGDKKNNMEKMLTRQPNRGFEGAEKKGSRNRPVEFEKHDDDLFNLDQFLPEGGKK
jgi:SNW domain-containing protein 1